MMVAYKTAADIQEEARMKAKLEENQQRMERLRNAKSRTIGLDVDALDAMVAEKEQKKAAEREAEAAEAARMRELQGILLEQEASIFDQQAQQKREMAQTWQLQAQQREEMKRKEKAGMPAAIIPEETGKSGCQNFDGEDTQYEQRRRLQAQQFRQWAQAQMSEKQNKIMQEKEESLMQHQYLQQVGSTCAEMESSHLNEQYNARMEMVMYNKRLAEEKKRTEQERKEAEQKANHAEVEGQLNDPYLVENLATAASTIPGRVRKDMFKGYGPDAKKQMCEENKRMTEEKAEKLRLEKEDDRVYARNLRNITEQLSMLHYEQDEAKRVELMQQKGALEAQRVELKSKNATAAEASKGTVGPEFFGHFGSSVR